MSWSRFDAVRTATRDVTLSLTNVRRISEPAALLLEWVQLTSSALQRAQTLALQQRHTAANIPAVSVSGTHNRHSADTSATTGEPTPAMSRSPRRESPRRTSPSRGKPSAAAAPRPATVSSIDVSAAVAFMSAPPSDHATVAHHMPSPRTHRIIAKRTATAHTPTSPTRYTADLHTSRQALAQLSFVPPRPVTVPSQPNGESLLPTAAPATLTPRPTTGSNFKSDLATQLVGSSVLPRAPAAPGLRK
jgi:hypothetical protein